MDLYWSASLPEQTNTANNEQEIQQNTQSENDERALDVSKQDNIVNDDNIQTSTAGNFEDNVMQIAAQDNDKGMEIKEEMTQEEVNAESPVLKAPINPTDPIVWHDPSLHKGFIVKDVREDRGETSAEDNAQTSHLIDGVYFPLLKINQRLIDNGDIIYMKLITINILPELKLTIKDSNNSITNLNSTGLNSEITLIITSPINGIYKKIKLLFYIDDVKSITSDNNEHTLTYSCTMKIPKMLDKYKTSMNFPDKYQWPGCTTCKQPKQEMPNSWEMLHYIAQQCKLGFASTKKCKEISDRYWRNFHTYKSLEDVMYKEKEFAGTTEDEAIFDWWIDVYGYIVMVNVPWVLTENVIVDNLAIYAIAGVQPTTTNQSNPKPKPILIHRTLTNSYNTTELQQNHNLLIRNYEIITDNSIHNEGVNSNINIFLPKGAGGTNSVQQTDIQVIENSIDGEKTEDYNTNRFFLRSVDMTGTNRQKRIELFDKYFVSKRKKQLVVELENFNLGLQRGTLVNVVITERNPQNKSAIINNLRNMYTDKPADAEDPVQVDETSKSLETGDNGNPNSISNSEAIQNPQAEIPNIGISGIYYIDGITFEFSSSKEQKIYQKLYLIKRDSWGNYITKDAPFHINTKDKK